MLTAQDGISAAEEERIFRANLDGIATVNFTRGVVAARNECCRVLFAQIEILETLANAQRGIVRMGLNERIDHLREIAGIVVRLPIPPVGDA